VRGYDRRLCEHVFVRWDEQRLETESGRTLPGYREPASVRTFDAPEALDTRFYEVRAKSALNRVPKQSQVPFKWTVNPYRGCTHACLYCASGHTPVLMGDGRVRPIAEIDVGDVIYGTVRAGRYRRYVRTEVLQHWHTRRAAYRVTLADGTALVTSGDHRFLTERGWKHVIGKMGGPWQRPYLTSGNSLLGTGAFAGPPEPDHDYRRGYLCGMIRGDGTIGHYSYRQRNGSLRDQHQFRLALADSEGLDRATAYLEREGVGANRRLFAAGSSRHREIHAIGAHGLPDVARVEELITWPLSPQEGWRRGFLAGIFDAEGSCGRGALRIANKDPIIIGWTKACLASFGFDYVTEPARENGCMYVRVRGGLGERLRFFHAFGPAISRKQEMQGMALKSGADLRVVAIEPLDEVMTMYDITTGTGDFISDGVVSHNCFARPTHKYLDLNAGRDFEREIVVKVNAPEVLRAELGRPSWKREHVALGTNTDPYQWVEGRYRLMPGIWEALRDSGTPGSVLTKSPLLLRDKDLMRQVPGFTANLSVPTLDEMAWRATEPRTPHPRARLEAVAELVRAGIPCGILIAPLMPGVNDSPEQVDRILELAADAGAASVGGIALHLRGEVRELWFDWLRAYRPDLLPRYERLYARGAYAPREERDRLAKLARGTGRRHIRKPPPAGPFRVEAQEESEAPARMEQATLF
jgi:DNA repair photolyase